MSKGRGKVDALEDLPGVEEMADPAEEDVASQLARLGAELSTVATDKGKRTAKLREIEAFLGRIRIEDQPELAESPAVQAFVRMFGGNLQPGETRNRGTLAEVRREWTMEDLRDFKKVTFIPMETLDITWNGIPCRVTAGEEVAIPEPFYDIYREHVQAQKNAEAHKLYVLGKSQRPPDPNWLTAASMRIRAYSEKEIGKGSIGVGPIADADAGAEDANAS